VFIFRVRTALGTLYIRLSSATCFGHFRPSSYIFHKIHGKVYRAWVLPFTVNAL